MKNTVSSAKTNLDVCARVRYTRNIWQCYISAIIHQVQTKLWGQGIPAGPNRQDIVDAWGHRLSWQVEYKTDSGRRKGGGGGRGLLCSTTAPLTWLDWRLRGPVKRGSWSSDKCRIYQMLGCQWEVEPVSLPEVFVFMVHFMSRVQARSCPLIRSAHSEVRDRELTKPPFYYLDPFCGARRLEKRHSIVQQ